MATFLRARLTAGRVEGLEPGQILMDVDEPALGVRRQGSARVYFVRKHRSGHRHYVTIGEHGRGGLTLTVAREKAKRLVADINDGFVPAEARARERGMPTLGALADEWLKLHVDAKLKPSTARQYRSTLHKIILSQLGAVRVDKITPDIVQRLHHQARATPYAANRALAVLSKMLNFAERCGYRQASTNPVRGIERFREQRRERFLSAEEFSRLGAALASPEIATRHSPIAVSAIELLVLTGMRLNEVLRLRWREVDLDRGLLLLDDSKTGKKEIVISASALRLLRRLPRTSSPYVYPNANLNRPLESVRKAWLRITRTAGLEGLRIQDLRHSFASVAAAEGASLPMIGRLLGHSQAQTTARYTHLALDPVRHLADRAAGAIETALSSASRTPDEKNPQ